MSKSQIITQGVEIPDRAGKKGKQQKLYWQCVAIGVKLKGEMYRNKKFKYKK